MPSTIFTSKGKAPGTVLQEPCLGGEVRYIYPETQICSVGRDFRDNPVLGLDIQTPTES